MPFLTPVYETFCVTSNWFVVSLSDHGPAWNTGECRGAPPPSRGCGGIPHNMMGRAWGCPPQHNGRVGGKCYARPKIGAHTPFRHCFESPLHRLRGRVREGAAPPPTFVGCGVGRQAHMRDSREGGNPGRGGQVAQTDKRQEERQPLQQPQQPGIRRRGLRLLGDLAVADRADIRGERDRRRGSDVARIVQHVHRGA